MKSGWVVLMLLISGVCAASPEVAFETEDGEKRQISATVPLGEGILAAVAVVGTNPAKAWIGEGEGAVALPLVIRDEVSRLTLLRVPDGFELERAPERGATMHLAAGSAVYLDPSDLETPSRVISWENRYRDTLLPMSLMRVHHPGEKVPLPGTALYDEKGRLVALCHQSAPQFGLGTYALPVEAIARVEKDLESSGKFVPSWIGIRMDVEDPVLSIRSVRPDSPASASGIQKGDILLAVGKREVRTYADAVNALYYLVNGEETLLRVLRGTKPLEMTVVPAVVPVTPPVDPPPVAE
jgi:hypothetical protein